MGLTGEPIGCAIRNHLVSCIEWTRYEAGEVEATKGIVNGVKLTRGLGRGGDSYFYDALGGVHFTTLTKWCALR